MDETSEKCSQVIRDIVLGLAPENRQSAICVRPIQRRKNEIIVRVENADGINVGDLIARLPAGFKTFVRNPVATGETGARLDIYIPIHATTSHHRDTSIGSGSFFLTSPRTTLVLWGTALAVVPTCRYLVC